MEDAKKPSTRTPKRNGADREDELLATVRALTQRLEELEGKVGSPPSVANDSFVKDDSFDAEAEVPELDTLGFVEDDLVIPEYDLHEMMQGWVAEAQKGVEKGPEQVEDSKAQEAPDDDGLVSPDDIAALFAAAGEASPSGAEEKANAVASTDDIASLFAAAGQGASADNSDSESSTMSADDIASLFAQVESVSTSPEPSSLSADQLSALLHSEPGPQSPPPPSSASTPSAPVSPMSPDSLMALMDEAAKFEETKSQPEVEGAKIAESVDFSEPTKTLADLAPRPDLPEIDPYLADFVPVHLAAAAMALPIERQTGKLVCLVAEPFDHDALGRLSKSVGLLIESRSTSLDVVVSGLKELYQPEQDRRIKRRAERVAYPKVELARSVVKLARKVV